jgi:hypothetical protein
LVERMFAWNMEDLGSFSVDSEDSSG